MELSQLFTDHIAKVQATYEKALNAMDNTPGAPKVEAVLIHSGSEDVYFADDRHIAFEAFGHFRYWLPLNKHDQMVLCVPGQKPTYFQVVPTDFWYEQGVENQSWWADCFNIVNLKSASAVLDHLPATRRIAFMGENTAFAGELGLPSQLNNEKRLTNYLDFHRGMKTAYEVEMVREANRMGMVSHKAAYDAFMAGGSELAIHQAYLNANDMIEHDSPYTNIVALDHKGAVLHYQGKRRTSGADSKVLLIDAGCNSNGYASDITRTYAKDGTHHVFASLLAGMDAMHHGLIEKSTAGTPYAEIHYAAHSGILDLLIDHEIVNGSRRELEDQHISKLFFPHGIGHLLGLQVHDVGGFISDDKGAPSPPPPGHPFLRLNRQMRNGMIFTIEPGLYFIPVLLDPERDNAARAKYLNWSLIDELLPLGGIRIEDNIHVTPNGPENLTR